MLRRLTAAFLAFALLQPALQGTGAACRQPGAHEHQGAATHQVAEHPAGAATAAHGSHEAPASSHHEGCPSDAAAQGCLTMPACAGPVALPMTGDAWTAAAIALALPSAPVTAPAAIARAPELPPPRA